MRDHGPAVLSASTLIGDDVRNPQGENLGEIKEIMLDVLSGQIAYAVLDFGGFLGIGNKLFAVPFQAMTLNAADKCFVLDVEKERLEHAPGFDQDSWPEHADYAYINDVRSYYGLEPYHNDAHV